MFAEFVNDAIETVRDCHPNTSLNNSIQTFYRLPTVLEVEDMIPRTWISNAP